VIRLLQPILPIPTRLVIACIVVLASIAPPPAAAVPIETVIRAAIDDYPTIRLARSEREIAAARIGEARALHLPVLDLGAAARIAGDAGSGPLPRMRVNLYAGGSIDALIERESLREQAFGYRETQVREEVAFAAAQAYLRLLRAHRLVDVQQRNLARHEKLAADFDAIARIDRGRRFDLVQARARLELVRGQLEDRLAEVATSRQLLARYYPQPIAPDSMTLPVLAGLPAESLADAGDVHPAVAAVRRDLLSAEANARAQRLQRRPRLDFEAIGGRDALSRVVVSWPAFDPALTAAEQGAVAALLGADASVREVELQVEETRRQARDDHVAASRRFEQARTQTALGAELVDIYFEQFRIGRRNLLDLLTAYAELGIAESTLAGTEVDVALARIRYEFAVGRLAATYARGPAPSPLDAGAHRLHTHDKPR
jgi:outer membrane protein, adhesin transport system